MCIETSVSILKQFAQIRYMYCMVEYLDIFEVSEDNFVILNFAL